MDGVVEETWRDARRSRMMAAAGRVFARMTFEQASMDEIAHEAAVGKPTLYRYFPSKDALFVAVFEHALDELEERLDRVLDETRGLTARLEALVAAIVPTFREHLVSLRFLDGAAAGADQSKRRVYRERRARIAGFIGRAIADGVAAGEMRAVDGTRVSHIIIGMLRSATANIQAPDDEIGRNVVDLLLNGLAPRPDPVPISRTTPAPGPAHASAGAAPRPCAGSHSSLSDGVRD